jgi:hypothetical protein
LISFLEENYEIQVQDEDIVPENFSSLNKISSFISERRKPLSRITVWHMIGLVAKARDWTSTPGEDGMQNMCSSTKANPYSTCGTPPGRRQGHVRGWTTCASTTSSTHLVGAFGQRG